MSTQLFATLVVLLARTLMGGTLVGAPLAGGAPVPAVSSEPFLLVRVLEETTLQPLPNAEVIDLDSGARRFTGVGGEAVVAWPASGRLRLRVRQLGFQYADRDVARATTGAAADDTLIVTLHRIAYGLPRVISRAESGCAPGDDPAAKVLSIAALAQLRMSAERYDTFRKAYPFRIRQLRRTIRFNADGSARTVREGTEVAAANEWGEPYRRGKVIDRSSRGFSVPLLFLSALADSVFWEHHCFAVRGMESLRDARVLRLEFVPALGIETVDWAGTAFVDSATSMLRRVEFQLAGLRDDDDPRRLEGYTTFRSPSPFIVVPDSTVAMWWRRDPSVAGAWTGPDVIQVLRLLEVTYRKAKPPPAATRDALHP